MALLRLTHMLLLHICWASAPYSAIDRHLCLYNTVVLKLCQVYGTCIIIPILQMKKKTQRGDMIQVLAFGFQV